MILNSPIKQIDHVLSIFREHQSYLNATELIDKINISPIVIEPSVLHRILEKLERDKFLFSLEDDNGVEYYSISFEGDLFIGYEKQQILDNEKVNRISQMETGEKEYRERLFWATLSAGIFAGLLLSWQVFLYLYPVHKDFPLFFWQK